MSTAINKPRVDRLRGMRIVENRTGTHTTVELISGDADGLINLRISHDHGDNPDMPPLKEELTMTLDTFRLLKRVLSAFDDMLDQDDEPRPARRPKDIPPTN